MQILTLRCALKLTPEQAAILEKTVALFARGCNHALGVAKEQRRFRRFKPHRLVDTDEIQPGRTERAPGASSLLPVASSTPLTGSRCTPSPNELARWAWAAIQAWILRISSLHRLPSERPWLFWGGLQFFIPLDEGLPAEAFGGARWLWTGGGLG